jgi:hypothetical protein
MIRKAKLSGKQIAIIKATHGHTSGQGLTLFSVKEKKKVHVSNPVFIEHTNGNRHIIIATGIHNGNKVSGIVKHK